MPTEHLVVTVSAERAPGEIVTTVVTNTAAATSQSFTNPTVEGTNPDGSKKITAEFDFVDPAGSYTAVSSIGADAANAPGKDAAPFAFTLVALAPRTVLTAGTQTSFT